MRSVPDESDAKDLARLNAEPWMLELLNLNPAYNSWGPGEDYMHGPDEKHGWSAAMHYDRWKDCDLGVDDLNEVVNFHFDVEREAKKCTACDGDGYGPEARLIADAFYDFAGLGTRWCDKITLDEAVALVERHRLFSLVDGKWTRPEVVDEAFVARVNKANERAGMGGFAHDAINRWILIEQRCKRLGVTPFHCPECDGHGHTFTAPAAHVELVLWLLHPRKGCSRGVTVSLVEQDDLPAVFAFLKGAADRNAERFAKAVAKATTEGAAR